MAWFFGDSFDLYSAPTDMIQGHWDNNSINLNSLALANGRFANSRALNWTSNSPRLYKNSGNNDQLHHFTVSFQQVSAMTGSSNGFFITLFDGATAQCSVCFKTDGSI